MDLSFKELRVGFPRLCYLRKKKKKSPKQRSESPGSVFFEPTFSLKSVSVRWPGGSKLTCTIVSLLHSRLMEAPSPLDV